MKFPTDILQKCRFLAGPTASGKTEVGLLLAESLGAEIFALDSMSLYRGMDIGTAKPTAEQRRRVPHHLIDLIEPHEEFSVADYLAAAESACRELLARGRTPLFVGGTGLYLRAVLRGVFAGPPADWEFRRRLQRQAREHSPGFLHQELRKFDPHSAEKLHPRDHRRIIRALEVHHLTGRPLSEQQQHPPLPLEERPRHVYWLSPPRDWLYERINRRVERMIEQGLIDEVRRLLNSEKPLSRTARQALGYKEVIAFLNGECDHEQMLDLIQRRSRQFAKRQHTWFRNLEECRGVPFSGTETPAELAARILALNAADEPTP